MCAFVAFLVKDFSDPNSIQEKFFNIKLPCAKVPNHYINQIYEGITIETVSTKETDKVSEVKPASSKKSEGIDVFSLYLLEYAIDKKNFEAQT